MEASKKGEKEVVEILLSAGADVNHQDKVGHCFLHFTLLLPLIILAIFFL